MTICRMKHWIACLLLALAVVWDGFAQTTHYVSRAGGHLDPFITWANAATSIADALAVAGDNDLVVVSNGEYNISATVNVITPVVLTNATGDPADVVINAQDLCRVMYVNHTNAVVSGFTLAHGRLNSSEGAGVYLVNGMVENCVIISNSWRMGAGVSIGGVSTLRQCVVSGNIVTGTQDAGAVHLNGANARVIGCRIYDNVASNSSYVMRGGGVCAKSGWIVGSTVEVNYCAGAGGGIWSYPTAGNQVVVSNCVIRGNQAIASGGGLHINNDVISAKTLVYNTAIVSNQTGINGGGISKGALALMDLRNCLILSNRSANNGGGMYLPGLTGDVINCSIYGNQAGGSGGGLYLNTPGPDVMVVNNIIWGNTAGNTYSNLYATSAENCFSYSCAGAPTTIMVFARGNITSDPLAVGSDNQRLQADSPCVNSGTNQAWMAAAVDLDGRARIDRFAGRVDMGCYEYVSRGTLFGIH